MRKLVIALLFFLLTSIVLGQQVFTSTKTMAKMKYNLDFFTQYGQFYVVDRDADDDKDGVDFWNEIAFENRLGIDEGVLGIRIENDECKAKVEVAILESRSSHIDFTEADHVVEGPLKITSGFLQIQDCPSSAVELEVRLDPGNYRCRIYSFDLDKAYQDEPEDHYKIEIWKDGYDAVKVLKQWHPNY